MDNQWVDEKIAYLHQVFGNFNSDQKFFFEPNENVYTKLESGEENDLQTITTDIAKHLGIVPTPISKYEWGIKMELETAGQFTMTRTSRRIQIPFYYAGKKYQLGAILAHEITHAFLFYRGIIFDNEEENELFTDIATIFIGLGKLLLNGLFSKPDDFKNNMYILGYLPYDLVLYCYSTVCEAQLVSDELITNNLIV